MAAADSTSFVECNEDELKALAEAVAQSKAEAVAAAGTALLVKVLTGSSIAAGAAEKAAAKVFGRWLADTPDARLQKAAAGFVAMERERQSLQEFAALVEPLIAFGLQSVHATVARVEGGQGELRALVAARADDLEGLLGQALRSIAAIGSSQDEMRALLRRAERAHEVAARAARSSQPPTAGAEMALKPPFPGAEIVHRSNTFDFFVSYAKADERWAEWIAWALEADGYKVTLQKWDFGPGKNFVLEMQAAASQAARTVAVLSPFYFASKFGQAEWAVALRDEPAGEARKLVPVRVAECTPPGLFGSIVYVDLYGTNEERARQTLLHGVQVGRAKPYSAPSLPGTKPESTVGTSGSPRPAFPGALPPIWLVPFRSNRFFVGRDAMLAQLHDVFVEDRTMVAVLCGLGGIGKTQLAVEYAYANKQAYEAVMWVSAESPEALRTNFAALTSEKALALPERRDKEQAVQVDAVLRFLQQNTRWLLVFDNADSEAAADAIVELMQQIPTGHVLLTARWASWPGDFELLEVQELSVDAASEFLLSRTKQTRSSELGSADEARAIARTLDGLPLALEQAAAFMLQKRIAFKDYSAKLSEALRHVIKGGPAHNKSLLTAWVVTLDTIAVEARVVLRFLAWFSGDPIPRELFLADAGTAFCDALSVLGSDVIEAGAAEMLERGLQQLADFSLIKLTANEFSCHRLLAAMQRQQLTVAERKVWLGFSLHIIEAATELETYDLQSIEFLKPFERHLVTLSEYADKLGMAEHAVLLLTRGATLFESEARYSEAEAMVRRALELEEQTHAPDDPRLSASLSNLAHLLKAMNRLDEAELLLQRALTLEESSDAQQSRVAPILNNLAHLLQTTNRFAEAEALLRRALTIQEEVYGPESLEAAAVENNLGHLLEVTNRAREAEQLLRHALTTYEKHYGPEAPRSAIVLNNLGKLLQDTGRFDEAEAALTRALAIDEERFGPLHPDVARDLNNLTLLYQATNRLDRAELLMQRAIVIDVQAYGPKHPLVGRGLNNLARVLHATNRLGDAVALMRRALSILESSYGPEHHEVATVLNNLAQVLRDKNQIDEAESLMRRALEIDERSFGSQHPDVAIDLNNLGILLSQEKRFGEAEPLIRRALSINEKSYGIEHHAVALGLNNLAILLHATQRQGEAEACLRKALEIDEKCFQADHPDVMRDIENLAKVLCDARRFGEAEPLMRRAIAIDEASVGTDHPRVARGLCNLAQLLKATNRPGEAEPLMRRALAIFDACLGTTHPLTEKIRAGLESLLG